MPEHKLFYKWFQTNSGSFEAIAYEWLFWSNSLWGQCLIFILSPDGFPPAVFSLFFSYKLASLQFSPYLESPPNCLWPQPPGFWGEFLHFGCIWSQSLWEEIKSYLFSRPFLPRHNHWTRLWNRWNNGKLLWVMSCSRSWTLGRGDSSLKSSGLCLWFITTISEAGVRVTRTLVFSTILRKI